MPIRVLYKDLDFGQTWYLKDDDYQKAYTLVGVVTMCTGNPKETGAKLILSHCGDETIVNVLEATQERDMHRYLDNKGGGDDDDGED